MIPFFHLTVIHLGPVPIQVWGLMVATGIAVGLWVATRRAKRLGLRTEVVLDVATWSVISAFVGARLVHVLFYDLTVYMQDPWEVFRIWHGGLSSVGGFVAGMFVGLWILKRRQVDVWRYADTMIFGLPVGLGIGRIGCFLIHDHPGTASDLFFAVEWPDGISRLDHGLLLSVNGFLMAGMFLLASRKERPLGWYLAAFGVWYGAVRFVLDFYRAVDQTYLGLTPAQYVCIALFVIGVGWFARRLRGRGVRATIASSHS